MKIDPLRGHIDDGETRYAAAARELYEESSGLFDLRNSNTIERQIAFSPRSDSGSGKVFHLRAVFNSDSAPENPDVLIQEYRKNRSKLGGCTEILDLAVEPLSRLFDTKRYPRLAMQTVDILSKLQVNIRSIPSITLARREISGLVSYCEASSLAPTPDKLDSLARGNKEIFFPLLTDPVAWAAWIQRHDHERANESYSRCIVSSTTSAYEFVARREPAAAAAAGFRREGRGGDDSPAALRLRDLRPGQGPLRGTRQDSEPPPPAGAPGPAAGPPAVPAAVRVDVGAERPGALLVADIPPGSVAAVLAGGECVCGCARVRAACVRAACVRAWARRRACVPSLSHLFRSFLSSHPCVCVCARARVLSFSPRNHRRPATGTYIIHVRICVCMYM